MSIYFNQTNIAPGTALFSTGGGGGSGSNFPNGIFTSSIVGLSSINGVAYTGGGGGGGSNFPNGLTIGTSNAGGFIYGVSSMTANLQNTSSNYTWFPIQLTLQPPTASSGDSMGIILRYDPLDSGQTALVLGARADGSAYLTGVWEGFISMPMEIAGANITFVGDSGETFMFMEGKAGAVGTVSTGVDFYSANNYLDVINGLKTVNSYSAPSIQAGTYNMTGTTETVTIPLAYPDSNFVVVATPTNPAPTYTWSAVATDSNTFSLDASASGLTFNWITSYTT